MRYKRIDRINELLHEEVADILFKEIKDPRIGFITITAVETTYDLSHAKVFVSIMGEEKDRELTIQGLKSATGYLRAKLKKRVNFHRIPEIEFICDSSIEYGDRIDRILQELKKKESWEDEKGG
ncbi:MAG: ribosome-binding factor A [Candidatus Schekmanbacteria bacterium RBG_16_38_11]|uniref:Ribosome-binding factor A n=1 Tax=Candidatus Schekmanbacteria bacterium RBG_16_38_11 TaxID=1817880 RepID=A0A1F7RW67_9BACT|nr:MAG: ribosome-binding factor A [Candidatus Schekmanbacteria bacterium RBG_16_38_11]